jgi:hypothetical protein
LAARLGDQIMYVHAVKAADVLTGATDPALDLWMNMPL